VCNIDNLYFTWKYPVIRHYLGRHKPNKQNFSFINVDDWWYFARKSKYFTKKTNILIILIILPL